jgi:hypothetical protein
MANGKWKMEIACVTKAQVKFSIFHLSFGDAAPSPGTVDPHLEFRRFTA